MIFYVFLRKRYLLDVTTVVKLAKFVLLVFNVQVPPETIILSSEEHESHRIHASLHFDLQASVLIKLLPATLTVWEPFDKYQRK